MNVLLIDDQINVVKGVLDGVDWNRLGVNKVFEAYNIYEAKNIIAVSKIEIMVCDIEMPLGNGIELLQWVREEFHEIECIFLTSHAEFEYAKAAIKLGSFDYLLQPIKYYELEIIIEKAIKKILEANEINEFYKYGVYLSENKEELVEAFWKDIIEGKYKNNGDKLTKAGEKLNISASPKAKYISVLISLMRWETQLEIWDVSLFKYAMNNILKEIFVLQGDIVIVQNNNRYITLLIPCIEGANIQEKQFLQHCQHLISVSLEYLKCSISCYIGKLVETDQLHDVFQQLVNVERNNVALYSKVFNLEEESSFNVYSYTVQDMERWTVLLTQKHNKIILEEAEAYIDNLVKTGKMSSSVLTNFHQDFMQMFYNVNEIEGIRPHDVFVDENMFKLYSKALNSVENLKEFLRYILTMEFKNRHQEEVEPKSIINEVKVYISKNMEKELCRNEIAEKVHLNPEYLSRLFKKETGFSLIEYIINERVKVSKDLLIKTNIPVSIIASKVGYSNFSHFSKIFKRVIGINPNEFRQNNSVKE